MNFLLTRRSLSRPSHSRPFNMHCPPRAQLLAVAYLGIIRLTSFLKKRGSNGTTGRGEKVKQHFKFFTKNVSVFSFHHSPLALHTRLQHAVGFKIHATRPWKSLGKARSGKKFDSRKIKLVFCESFYAKRSSAMNVQSNKVKTKKRKLKHSQ